MLKPEMLENLICDELKKIDYLLWEAFPSEPNLPTIVKEIYKHRIKHKTHFFWANLTLLMAKSLNSVVPKPIIRIAAIIEVLVIGRRLKQEALRSQWAFPESSAPEAISSPVNQPGILTLAADYLMAYSLERLSSFNVNCFLQGFSLAQKDFIESELLLKTNSLSENFSDVDYLALIKLRIENFAIQLALAIAKLCKAPEDALQGLVNYAKHFGMAVGLYQELIPLYSMNSPTTLAVNLLKLTVVNYPILFALKQASSEEKILIKRCFSEIPQLQLGLVKPIFKILQRYDTAHHISELIKSELQQAGCALDEIEGAGNYQALYGLLEFFIEQCSDQTQSLLNACNHLCSP